MSSEHPNDEALRRTADDLARMLDNADVDAHLDADTVLIPYVAGTLSAVDKEIADSHLDDCALCRAELDDLLALRDRPRRRFGWAPIAGAVAATAAAVALLIGNFAEEHPPVRNAPPPAIMRPDSPPQIAANPRWEALVADALRSGRLPFPAELEALGGKRGELRGSSGAERDAVAPAGVVVRETRPRFTWRGTGYDSYVVSVFDGEREVVRSPQLTARSWTPPHDLPRGRTLVWQVRATRGEEVDIIPAPPAPPAAFRIVSQDDQHALDEAARLHPDDALLRAVLLARAGLREEAIATLRKVPTQAGNEKLRRAYGAGG